MKLWLDDERDPSNQFIIDNFGSSAELTWVKTAHEAIVLFKNNKISYISFDHDLGDSSNGTGLDVAKWIEEAAFNGLIAPLQWAVHSKNPVGSQNIIFAMQSAEKFWGLYS